MMRVQQPWLLFVTFLMVFLSITSANAGRTLLMKPDEPSRLTDEKTALLLHHGLIPLIGWRWLGGLPWALSGLPWALGGLPWALGGLPWGRRGFFGGRRGFPGGRGGFSAPANYVGKAEIKGKNEAREIRHHE
ncbi:hypothetical protein QVD17_17317 [Tagetes erecta]|uniref:Transmembrane protein n=1 Tax=Tagetes erecta TaxID=13708 RepID=A0AAD8KSU5_TARER|nr:hypothetical protein QVD17_17317 [Tagetes erecta]